MRTKLTSIPLWLWVVAVFLLLNLATYNWYTTIWSDEVMLSDAAANLHFGHGFTSSAWPTQHYGEIWAGNTPLYPLLLAGWYAIAGFGMFQTRALDYLFWSGGVTLVCLGAGRLGIVRRPVGLVLLAALLFSGDGVVFNYRSGRYDSAIFLVAAACFAAFALASGWRRNLGITLAAATFMPTALTLGPFTAILGGLVWLFTGRKYFTGLVCAAAGLVAGLAALAGFYWQMGLWHTFRTAIKYSSQLYYPPGNPTPVWRQKLADFPSKLLHDPATLLLFVCLVVMLTSGWRKLDAAGRRAALFGLCVYWAVPAASLVGYAYQIYHTWQAYVPLAICAVGTWERWETLAANRWRTWSAVAVVVAIFSLGLGLRLALGATDRSERDYTRVEAFIHSTVRPSDIVFANFTAFYALHEMNVQTYYYPKYLQVLTKAEAGAVNCLVIDPASAKDLETQLGGQWQPTGETYLHEQQFANSLLRRCLPGYFKQQTNQKYNLAVYRRVPSAPPRTDPNKD